MAQEKRARRGFLVLFSIFSLNGVMACQSESDSSTEAVRVTAGQTACFDKLGKQIPC